MPQSPIWSLPKALRQDLGHLPPILLNILASEHSLLINFPLPTGEFQPFQTLVPDIQTPLHLLSPHSKDPLSSNQDGHSASLYTCHADLRLLYLCSQKPLRRIQTISRYTY